MIPPLYKYVTADGLDILLSRRIKATPPNSFNDAFEFQPLFDGRPSRKFVRRHVHDKQQLREQYNLAVLLRRTNESFKAYKARCRHVANTDGHELADRVVQRLDEERTAMVDKLSTMIGVICFTTVPNSLLMWAHYSASHTGLVIEFNVTDRIFVETPRLSPVIYSQKRPVLPLDGNSPTSLSDAGWIALLTKSTEWQYEAEWRTTTPLALTIQSVQDGRTEFFAPLPPSAIKSVILGARSSQALQCKVLGLAGTEAFRHISIAQARLHDTEYRLETTKIE